MQRHRATTLPWVEALRSEPPDRSAYLLKVGSLRPWGRIDHVAEAAFWGPWGASSLIVASEWASIFEFSKFVITLIMAFGGGVLIPSFAFELVVPALDDADGWVVAVLMGVGSPVFLFGNRAIANLGESRSAPISTALLS